MRPIRTTWKQDFPNTIVDQPLAKATGHQLYTKAKQGDIDAAFELAQSLVSDRAISLLQGIGGIKQSVIVPVHAIESMGVNKIPIGIAHVLADRLDLSVHIDIVQAIKVSRTGADGWHRLSNAPYFDGNFPQGQCALLVDDTLTQGGTFASLKGHIESQGGEVLGAYALTGKQYSRQLRLSRETLAKLRGQYGHIEQWWQGTFGYGFDFLTEWEARYIINSGKTPNQVRDRVLAARYA